MTFDERSEKGWGMFAFTLFCIVFVFFMLFLLVGCMPAPKRIYTANPPVQECGAYYTHSNVDLTNATCKEIADSLLTETYNPKYLVGTCPEHYDNASKRYEGCRLCYEEYREGELFTRVMLTYRGQYLLRCTENVQ